MCIIIAKYRGVKLPKKETLENCFYNNNDGSGIAYTHNGRVNIEKGFNKFDEFYKRLKELDKQYNLKNENVILHFRIATSGNIDAKTCHPFPISDEPKKLQKPTLENLSEAVAHNGVISDYTYKNEYNLSDTQNFIKDFITPLKKMNSKFYKREDVQKLLKNTCKSKLAFIDKDTIVLIGDFEKAQDNCYYSNGSYKNDYFKASKYTNYHFDWDDYYAKHYKENDEFFCYKKASEIMQLDETIFVQYSPSDPIEKWEQGDTNYCIDENYNLYFINDWWHTLNGVQFELEFVSEKVNLHDYNGDFIQFEPSILNDEGGGAND